MSTFTVSRRKRPKNFFNLLYLCLLIILTLAGAEIFLRFNSRVRERKNHIEWLRSIMSYDELLGWKHIPGTEVWSETAEYRVQYIINAKGFRDRERS